MACFRVAFLLNAWLAMAFASLHPKENTTVCGSQRTFRESSGVIESPGYPYRYPLNVFCTYDIVVDDHLRIELNWNEFDVDGNMPNCDGAQSDFVEVFTGCGSLRHRLTKFCSRNSGKPHAIHSVDNCLSLNFLARPNNSPKISKGFSVVYKSSHRNSSMIQRNCNRTLLDGSGVIHSSFWPLTYKSSNMDICFWNIKLNDVMAVKLTFMDLAVDSFYYDVCRKYCLLQYEESLVLQGVASLYLSSPLKLCFSGMCDPFAYDVTYSELKIKWKKRNTEFYPKRRGFVIGYVAYMPVNESSALATWNYALLASSAALLIFVIILFACRHKRRINYISNQNYTRFVNVGTDTDDIRTCVVDDSCQRSEVRGQRSEEDIEETNNTSDIPLHNEVNGFRLANVATHDGDAPEVNLDDLVSERIVIRRRVPLFSDSESVEVLFHPSAPSHPPAVPSPDPVTSTKDECWQATMEDDSQPSQVDRKVDPSSRPEQNMNSRSMTEEARVNSCIPGRIDASNTNSFYSPASSAVFTENLSSTSQQPFADSDSAASQQPSGFDPSASSKFPLATPQHPLAAPHHPLATPQHPLAAPHHPLATPHHPLTAPQQPPAYDQIFNELQELSILVDELMSDQSDERSTHSSAY